MKLKKDIKIPFTSLEYWYIKNVYIIYHVDFIQGVK